MQKWKKGNSLLIPLLVLTALMLSGCLQSRVGFQGQLTDPDGEAVPDGDYQMTIRFFPADEGGSSVFEQTSTVTVQEGLFDVDITDFPPHIFSGELGSGEDTLYMEVEVEGEVLEPRRKVSGSPFAHALVAGSGVVGPRQDEANVADGGYHAALTVVNTELPNNNPGYALQSTAANAGLFTDNIAGDTSLNESVNPEDNPDIILGGEYLADVSGTTEVDTFGGPGVIASDPSLPSSDLHLRSNDEIWLYKDWDNNDASEFRIYDNGTDDIQLVLDNDGDLFIDGAYTGGGADFAELIDVEGDEADYEPGDVLVISDQTDRAVALATSPNSTAVIGVYSANPGFVGGAPSPGDRLAQEQPADSSGTEDPGSAGSAETSLIQTEDGAIEVGIAGIVPVKVSAENGVIHRGDLLTTSGTAGHAMKATDPAPGTILGKAMGTLDSGTGVIDVLIMLQ